MYLCCVESLSCVFEFLMNFYKVAFNICQLMKLMLFSSLSICFVGNPDEGSLWKYTYTYTLYLHGVKLCFLYKRAIQPKM